MGRLVHVLVIVWLVGSVPVAANLDPELEAFGLLAAYLVLPPIPFLWLRIRMTRPKGVPSGENWYPLWFAAAGLMLSLVGVPSLFVLLALDQGSDRVVYADVWPLLWAILTLFSFGIAAVLSMSSWGGALGDPYPRVHIEGCGRLMAIILVAGLGLAGLGVAGVAALT